MADPQALEKVRKLVRDTLVSEFELEAGKVVPEARLREELGLDSLDGVDLIVALEKALAVQIPESFQPIWDWNEWVFNRANGQVVKKTDPTQLIPYNYIIFGVTKYDGM